MMGISFLLICESLEVGFNLEPDDGWRAICKVQLFCFGVHGVYRLA